MLSVSSNQLPENTPSITNALTSRPRESPQDRRSSRGNDKMQRKTPPQIPSRRVVMFMVEIYTLKEYVYGTGYFQTDSYSETNKLIAK